MCYNAILPTTLSAEQFGNGLTNLVTIQPKDRIRLFHSKKRVNPLKITENSSDFIWYFQIKSLSLYL